MYMYIGPMYIGHFRIILDCKIKQIHRMQCILQKHLLGEETPETKFYAHNPLHRSRRSCTSI